MSLEDMQQNSNLRGQPQRFYQQGPPQIIENIMHSQNYNIPYHEFMQPPLFHPFTQQSAYCTPQLPLPPPPPLIRKPFLHGENSSPSFLDLSRITPVAMNPAAARAEAHPGENAMQTALIQNTPQIPVDARNVVVLIHEFIKQNPDHLYQISFNEDHVNKLVITPISLNSNSANMTQVQEPSNSVIVNRTDDNTTNILQRHINLPGTNEPSVQNSFNYYRSNADSSDNTTNTDQTATKGTPSELEDTSTSTLGISPIISTAGMRDFSVSHQLHDLINDFVKQNCNGKTLVDFGKEDEESSTNHMSLILKLQDDENRVTTMRMNLQIMGCNSENNVDSSDLLESMIPEKEMINLSPIPQEKKQKKRSGRKKKVNHDYGYIIPKKCNSNIRSSSPIRRSMRIFNHRTAKLSFLQNEDDLLGDSEVIRCNLGTKLLGILSRKQKATDLENAKVQNEKQNSHNNDVNQSTNILKIGIEQNHDYTLQRRSSGNNVNSESQVVTKKQISTSTDENYGDFEEEICATKIAKIRWSN